MEGQGSSGAPAGDTTVASDRTPTQRLAFLAFYGLTVLGAGALLAWLWRDGGPRDVAWWEVIVFLAFLLLADTKLAEAQVGGEKVLSSKSIDLIVIALFGPAIAAGLEAVSSLVRGFMLRRMPARKAVFNAAMLSVSAGVAGIVYHALPWHDRFDSPLYLIPLLVAILAYSACNQLLLTGVMSLDARMPAPEIYRHSFGWSHLRILMDAPFAAMVILLYMQAGVWTLLLYLAPVLVLYQADRLTQEMKQAHINSIAALTTALEQKEDEHYTHGHSYRVAKYAVKIGRALGLSPRRLEMLEYGGLLHDIGKLAITNDIIDKPGKLTPEEFAEQARHPNIGADIVKQIRFLHYTADMVRHHHERPDGKGYPDGLSGADITVESRILSVCDAFDAMTTDRSYRPARTVEYAMEELVRCRGSQFDPDVVDAVLQLYRRGEFGVIRQTDGLVLEIQRPGRPVRPTQPQQAAPAEGVPV